MTWELGVAANATVACAYAAIAWLVLGGLARSGRLRTDLIGTATGTVLAACSVGHAGHMLHLVAGAGVSGPVAGVAARVSDDLPLALLDLVTGVVAIAYFARQVRSAPGHGPGATFDDDAASAHPPVHASHEEIVQGLVVACYQLDDDDREGARRTLSATLEQARTITSSPCSPAMTLDQGVTPQ